MEVVLTIYNYDSSKAVYYPKGKSALLNASKTLQINVTQYIVEYTDNLQGVTLITDEIEGLNGWVPFSMEVDINSRLTITSKHDSSHSLIEFIVIFNLVEIMRCELKSTTIRISRF